MANVVLGCNGVFVLPGVPRLFVDLGKSMMSRQFLALKNCFMMIPFIVPVRSRCCLVVLSLSCLTKASLEERHQRVDSWERWRP